MKTLLVMFIVGICALGMRSPEIMQAIGLAASAQDPAELKLASLTAETPAAQQERMTADQFAELSKTDPNAYQKFVNGHQVRERSEVDKLLNFFARGKYE